MFVGLAALGAGVIVVSYGTHLRTQSTRFEEYEKAVLDRMAADNPDTDIAPGAGIGMALASSWEFVGCVTFFLSGALVFWLLVLRAVGLWSRTAALIGTGVVAAACCVAAFILSRDALHAFEWEFTTLGVGGVVFAIGLILTGIGSPYLTLEMWEPRRDQSASVVM